MVKQSKIVNVQVLFVPAIEFPNSYNFIIVLFPTPSADTHSVFHHLANEVSAFRLPRDVCAHFSFTCQKIRCDSYIFDSGENLLFAIRANVMILH